MRGPPGREDYDAILTHIRNSSQENEIKNMGSRNDTSGPDRLGDSMDISSGYMNLRFSQELYSLVRRMHSRLIEQLVLL